MATLTPYQRDILVKTILGEARGEGDVGQAAVAWNIINRANSGQYPSDPAAVALQNKQYSTWNSGEGGNNPGQFKPGTKAYDRAAQIVDAVAAGQIPDMTGGALQYHASNITPYWADEANKAGALKVGNHTFYPTRPVPPGEIPSVGTLLDIRKQAPTPAIQSQGTAALRANTSPTGGNTALQSALSKLASSRAKQVTPAVPSKGIQAVRNGMFTQPAANASKAMGLGDSLGMNPIQGGTQQAPMFDAAYDTTSGAMRMVQPVNTQGVGTFATAPKPAQMSPQLAGRRATNPVLQAALNSKVSGGLKPTVSASDLARGKSGISTVASYPTTGIGQPPATKVVQSVPMPAPKLVAPSKPLTPAYNPLTSQQKLALLGGGSSPPIVPGPAGAINPNKDPSRLAANAPGVGGITSPLIPYPASVANRPLARPYPVQVANVGKIAPVPMPANMRPTGVATALATTPPKVAPVPLARPNFGMGGPILNNPQVQGLAPVPMARPQAVATPPIMNAVAQLQAQGLSPSDAYTAANIAAAQNARDNATSPSHQSSNSWFNSVTGR